MGEVERGHQVHRITVSFYCANDHEYNANYIATIALEDIPQQIDCPKCGLPAGHDKAHPPHLAKGEPYRTHLAYVKERRTEAEAEELLAAAVNSVRERRQRLAEEESKK